MLCPLLAVCMFVEYSEFVLFWYRNCVLLLLEDESRGPWRSWSRGPCGSEGRSLSDMGVSMAMADIGLGVWNALWRLAEGEDSREGRLCIGFGLKCENVSE